MNLTSLKNSIKKREKLFLSSDTDCFRLFNGKADGIEGITIDRYGCYILIQVFDYKLLNNNDFFEEIANSIKKNSPIDIKGIFLKNRTKLEDSSQVSNVRKSKIVFGEYPNDDFYVLQSGIKVYVDLVNSLNTGLFMDMRSVRDTLKDFLPEVKNMLNLFCYTGIFSVFALKNGVESAVNVDLANPVLKRAIRNYKLNDLHIDDRDFIQGSSAQIIKWLIKKERKFSLVVFDPPTFSRNKKETFSIKSDYKTYLKQIEKLVLPGGYVLDAINTYSIDKTQFIKYHPKNWEMVFYKNEADDFPYINDPYLKVALWKIN